MESWMTENEDMEEEVCSKSDMVLEENDEGKCDICHEERGNIPIVYLYGRKLVVLASTLWNQLPSRVEDQI